MKAYNSVAIAPVRSLEVGDFIAVKVVGGVSCGRITGVVYSEFDLTDAQRKYVKAHDLTVPAEQGTSGIDYYLIFGEFTDHHHLYLDFDVNVAVFLTEL